MKLTKYTDLAIIKQQLLLLGIRVHTKRRQHFIEFPVVEHDMLYPIFDQRAKLEEMGFSLTFSGTFDADDRLVGDPTGVRMILGA